MEQEEEPLSEHESLLIIQQMIDTAKQEQKDDGKGWIIWGWLLFMASVLTVFNLKFNWLNPFFFWNAFGAVTLVLKCATQECLILYNCRSHNFSFPSSPFRAGAFTNYH